MSAVAQPRSLPIAKPMPPRPRSVAAPPAVQVPRSHWVTLLFAGEIRRNVSSCLISTLMHAAVILLLAVLFRLAAPRHEPRMLIVSHPSLSDSPLTTVQVKPSLSDVAESASFAPQPQDLPLVPLPDIRSPVASPSRSEPMSRMNVGHTTSNPRDLLLQNLRPTGGGLGGRSGDSRGRLLSERGGTPGSEEAVVRGLAWLAAHQRNDGSWRFNHQEGVCQNRCADPGTEASTAGAAGLVLLPFLGAGHTPEQGEYSETVRRGIYYLQSRMLSTPNGGDLREGTMYAQGIAAIALCEAYAMTHDESMRPVAQQAVDFICYAQHPKGGWRYEPGQPGDMTVTGWQLMALKSAQMAGLRVPPQVLERAKQFLDTMHTGGGACYGYLSPGRENTPTAVGLLSRMYMGWSQGDPRLARGVDFLARAGPSRDDVYFNYYATQVLHHYEGSHWDRWNGKLRDYLIQTQSRAGHEDGSWYFVNYHATTGGRLYTTAMCVMILEVYYRYMPLYERRALEEGF